MATLDGLERSFRADPTLANRVSRFAVELRI